MVTDLANKTSACDNRDFYKLRNPDQPKTPIPIMIKRDLPMGIACSIAINHISTTQISPRHPYQL
jgi:hypothetical protein